MKTRKAVYICIIYVIFSDVKFYITKTTDYKYLHNLEEIVYNFVNDNN